MERQLYSLGMPFTIHDAVDGHALDLQRIPEYNRRERLRKWGIDLTPGEIGAYMSHYNVLKIAARTDNLRTLILEDDAALPTDLPQILRFVEGLDPRFEFVRLHGSRVPRHIKLQDVGAGRRFARLLDVASGATAYVVNQAGATKLIRAGKSILRQIDVTIDRYWDHGLRMFAVLPYPIRILPDLGSDIGPRINAWELPGMRHWRMKAKLWKFSDSVRKRTKNIEIRLEIISSRLPGRPTS
jgi:glycosyl transferase family 25